MTDPTSAEAQRGWGSRQRPSELLRTFASDPQSPRPDEVQRLVAELDIRQREMEVQNQELQAAQRQLKAYRDRYIDLYDFAPLGYVTLDEDGYIQEINLAGAKLLGGQLAELVGYPFSDYVAATDRAGFLEHNRKCCGQRQDVTSELGLVTKDGRLVAVQLHSVPVTALEHEGTFCKTAITDITDHKRTEDAIQAERNLLRTLIDNLPDAVYIKDTQSRFVVANLAAARITGATAPGDLLGKSDCDFYPEEVAAEYRSDEQQLMRTGEPLVDKDEPHRDPQGNPRTVLSTKVPIKDSRGTVVGLVGISRDVTERKQTEETLRESKEQLRESEQFYRTLIETLPVTVVLADATGRVSYVSPAAKEMFDLAPGEGLGTLPTDWIAPEHHESVRQRMRQVLVDLQPQPPIPYKMLKRDGTAVWAQVASAPVLDREGRLKGVVTVCQDITGHKRAEESLQAAKESAERGNRAKDHFLAVLSHELRIPLTPVVMGLSMLQDRPDLDPTSREILEMARRNVELEALLIDDLLDVSRIAQGKIELSHTPVELSTIIDRAVEVCKPDIEARRLDFGVDLGPAPPYWVEADASRLEQVFWNLLKNAIKFTPPGGWVGIRIRKDEGGTMKDEGNSSSLILPPSSFVIAEVNDSGIGMEPEVLSRIFNAFEQAERSITQRFGGLGLGLAISKALVEMHGGRIEAHSEGPGKGATFSVRLPLTVPAGRPKAGTAAAPPPEAVRSLRILLVEDHGVTAKLMRMVLTSDGHSVETAGDVGTALELAGQQAFDLLVSDLGLPDGSGYDLMRQLRERGHKFPGIALSGYGQGEDIQWSREAGFAAHLTKPASRRAVLDAVAQFYARPDGLP